MRKSYFLSASGLFEDGDPLRKLPETMYYHCMAKIDKNTYVKVGTDEELYDTWIYRHYAPFGTDRWTKGPTILGAQGNFYHVKCGVIKTGIASCLNS